MSAPDASLVPPLSPRLHRWFAWYARRYLRKHFHAVRLLRAAPLPPETEQPVVFYLNHPSWWDPLVALFLATNFYPQQKSFGPMDAAALQKYGMLRRLGFFPVEPGTAKGARQFLETAGAVLSRPRHALWLTPQGKFSDVRTRPVQFAAGLGHLARRHPAVLFVPVALEYVWWFERSPEVLVAAGAPVALPAEARGEECSRLLEAALEEIQDRLAAASLRRDATEFTTLLSGRGGVGGVYDWWRRLRARLAGKAFRAEHHHEP